MLVVGAKGDPLFLSPKNVSQAVLCSTRFALSFFLGLSSRGCSRSSKTAALARMLQRKAVVSHTDLRSSTSCGADELSGRKDIITPEKGTHSEICGFFILWSYICISSALQLATTLSVNSAASIRLRLGLACIPTQQDTLVRVLRARRNIQSRVLIKEVHRLERHFDDFARHDWEVFDARDLINISH